MNMPFKPDPARNRLPRPLPPFECIALLLQGGGALGAYQGGVYEALAEANLHPDWVAGISIGAINAALIAGNAPEVRVEKLREFWETVTADPLTNYASGTLIDAMSRFAAPLAGETQQEWAGLYRKFFSLLGPASSPLQLGGDAARQAAIRWFGTLATLHGAPGMYAPRILPPWLQPAGSAGATSFYDTSALKGTLERLIDFDRINAGEMRFSVGAVNVTSGNFVYFDNRTHEIRPEHIMASGALPPGFPAVEIEGELYWDGGLVSNTPLQWVLESSERQDTLAFQVDLWSARGAVPTTLGEVVTRQKDIQYSSRTRANSDQFKKVQKMRNALAELLVSLPNELKATPEFALLQPEADRKVYNIIQLIYRSKPYEEESKDFEFSRRSMEDHWTSGRNDTARTLRHPEVLERPTSADGVFTFDVAAHVRMS
jgi:NTE family protein